MLRDEKPQEHQEKPDEVSQHKKPLEQLLEAQPRPHPPSSWEKLLPKKPLEQQVKPSEELVT